MHLYLVWLEGEKLDKAQTPGSSDTLGESNIPEGSFSYNISIFQSVFTSYMEHHNTAKLPWHDHGGQTWCQSWGRSLHSTLLHYIQYTIQITDTPITVQRSAGQLTSLYMAWSVPNCTVSKLTPFIKTLMWLSESALYSGS